MPMRSLYQLLTTLWLFLLTAPADAQTDGSLFHGATRDKAGNLWFTTTGAGVYRYDEVSGGLTQDGGRSKQADSVVVFLESYFNNDQVSVLANGVVVWRGLVTTDPVSGLADSFTFKRPSGKEFVLSVQSQGCSGKRRVAKKDKYLLIHYYKTACEVQFEVSKKAPFYL